MHNFTIDCYPVQNVFIFDFVHLVAILLDLLFLWSHCVILCRCSFSVALGAPISRMSRQRGWTYLDRWKESCTGTIDLVEHAPLPLANRRIALWNLEDRMIRTIHLLQGPRCSILIAGHWALSGTYVIEMTTGMKYTNMLSSTPMPRLLPSSISPCCSLMLSACIPQQSPRCLHSHAMRADTKACALHFTWQSCYHY